MPEQLRPLLGGTSGVKVIRLDGKQGNSLGGLISALMGRTSYDFIPGHLDYDIGRDIPREELERLIELKKYVGSLDLDSAERPQFEPVLTEMLANEAELVVSDKTRIIPFHLSARGAIDHVLRSIAQNKKVALPTPNWFFWSKLDGAAEGRYGFEYFQALTPDQLVSNFKKLSKQKDLGALLLVSPSNPLGFSIDSGIAEELDKIAQKNGIEVVIDDLLRGNQPFGKRQTIARYFSRPFVVEGFSHRFGENPLGALSYVLLPEGDIYLDSDKSREQDCICPEVLKLAFKYSSRPIFEQLVVRNRAFDKGIRETFPDIEIVRTHEGSITSIVTMPKALKGTASKLYETAALNNLGIAPIAKYFPEGSVIPRSVSRKFRIAIGAMDEGRVYYGARFLGKGMACTIEHQ